jgi:hypothetical protein
MYMYLLTLIHAYTHILFRSTSVGMWTVGVLVFIYVYK